VKAIGDTAHAPRAQRFMITKRQIIHRRALGSAFLEALRADQKISL
jgi:hypothetical protein